MHRALLILHRGEATRFELGPQGATVGRTAPCEIVIDDARVSRRHARFSIAASGVEIEDLGSHNGTIVFADAATAGGETVSIGREYRLTPGARLALERSAIVQIGPAVIALEHDGAAANPPRGVDGVVADPVMCQLFALAERVAGSELGVVIQGETGTGKEVLAQFLHQRSRRAARPLLAINCAAVPDQLIEAELFGYEKGAFTGAAKTTVGPLEAAHLGTMLLDEIGELSLASQAKLLRVLEVGQFMRVGGRDPIVIDVRYISATHRDLSREVAGGRFREDLYYRLNGITLTIPPLRDRRGEIATLAERFADGRRISPHAIARLAAHDWPGNIRELRNVVRRASVLCDGVIDAEHIQFTERPTTNTPTPSELATPETLRERAEALEKQRIVDALEACGGNQTKTAQLLGLSRRALIVRLAKYDLPRPRRGR